VALTRRQANIMWLAMNGAVAAAIAVTVVAASRLPATKDSSLARVLLLVSVLLTADAAVIALVRGKGCGEGEVVPYVTNPDDAAAAIDWIARQPWSDGRVGMFGGSYSGGAAWAATKRMRKALKTIVVGAPVGPGLDVPMENGIFWNFVYRWPFFTTDDKWLDNATCNDRGRWLRLDRTYYLTGRPYRDLPAIDGKPNPIFESWIAHPAYDSFWQAMIPYGEEASRGPRSSPTGSTTR
jgi:uncharacterized protein